MSNHKVHTQTKLKRVPHNMMRTMQSEFYYFWFGFRIFANEEEEKNKKIWFKYQFCLDSIINV